MNSFSHTKFTQADTIWSSPHCKFSFSSLCCQELREGYNETRGKAFAGAALGPPGPTQLSKETPSIPVMIYVWPVHQSYAASVAGASSPPTRLVVRPRTLAAFVVRGVSRRRGRARSWPFIVLKFRKGRRPRARRVQSVALGRGTSALGIEQISKILPLLARGRLCRRARRPRPRVARTAATRRQYERRFPAARRHSNGREDGACVIRHDRARARGRLPVSLDLGVYHLHPRRHSTKVS